MVYSFNSFTLNFSVLYFRYVSYKWHLIQLNFVILQHDNLCALARTKFRTLMPNATTQLFRLKSTILFCAFNWSTRLPRWLSGRESACQCVQSLGREDPLQKDVTTHSRILSWIIPQREEPGRLQSLGLQKSGTLLSDWACMRTARSWSCDQWALFKPYHKALPAWKL